MSHVRLAPDEARRALYVDFEGRKAGPPVLLGCTTKSRVRSQLSVWQAVTDPTLTPLAVADGIEPYRSPMRSNASSCEPSARTA